MKCGDNYYWVLGLTPDTATIADIKANYRKLALRWHPDHNPGNNEAEEMFYRIQEAYAVLSDPGKKAEYDRQYNFEDASGSVAESPFVQTVINHVKGVYQDPRKERDGGDVSFTVEVDFRTTLLGDNHRVVVFNRECDCPKCHGYASLSGTYGVGICPHCQGLGKVTRQAKNLVIGALTTEVCPDCKGRGYFIKDPCPVCDAAGRIIVPSEVVLNIPAGVNNGTVLRVVGAGHMGHLNKWNGDFYANIKIINDSVYHREGSNLFTKIKIPVETMILGGEIDVPLPLGGTQKENVPPCRPGHWSFAINGHGVPIIGKLGKRGNLVVTLEAEFPNILTEIERGCLEDYANERRKSESTGRNNEDRSEQRKEEADNI